MREVHPHLHQFDSSNVWKYLIIGTFPPNTALRQKTYIDYFYGNKGSLWKIIHDIYSDRGYSFFGGAPDENLAEIKRWQKDYCVGLSDTIVSCERKFSLASNDTDLVNIEYNVRLRDYLLQNGKHIEKVIFTSSFGKNSAFSNFKIIMGDDLSKVQSKLVIGLPSPSGASNITFFNARNEASFGLRNDFYEYIKQYHPSALAEFEARWDLKKKNLDSQNSSVRVPASPKGLVKEYKLWRYRSVLPSQPCS